MGETWVLLVGAGVGGTYVAHNLARKCYNLNVCDGDEVRTENLGTQKYGKEDVGRSKAIVTAEYSAKRTSLPVKTVGVPYMFSEAVKKGINLEANIVIAFTDSFLSRFEVSEYFYEEKPVVSAGLGESGTWGWAFIQKPEKACLRCCFPEVNPNKTAGCTGLTIDSVKLTSSLVTYAVDTLVLDHYYRERSWNYRKIDLSGFCACPDEKVKIKRSEECGLCGNFKE
ncbi:ThiF family adenylyltransferase [Candidatus Bipolaricaulota bacterium]|nr:ThiF family adenylyltransferase [Candidatus Bipolaricaulota bacterium]